MDNKTVSRIAIVLFAIVIAFFGVSHFLDPENLATSVPNFIPGGRIWVYIVGVAFILAAIAFISNKQVRLAGYLLAALLVIFVLAVHLPGFLNSGDKEMRQISFVNLLKDLGLASCALLIGSSNANK